MLLAIGLVADDELCGIEESVVEIVVGASSGDDQRREVERLALDVEITFVGFGVRVQMHASGLFDHRVSMF